MDNVNGDEIAKLLLRYASEKNFTALFAVAIIIFVWLARKGILHDKVLGRYKWLVWLRGDVWGWVLAVSSGIAGGALTALKAHTPITGALVLSGAINGIVASGLFVGVDKAVKAARKPKTFPKKEETVVTPPVAPRQDDKGAADTVWMLILTVGVTLLVGASIALNSGCSETNYYRAAGTVASVRKQCVEFTGDLNRGNEAKIQALYEGKQVTQGDALRDKWRPMFDAFLSACGVGKDLVVQMLEANPKNAGDLVAKGLAWVAETAARFAEYGKKFSALGGK